MESINGLTPEQIEGLIDVLEGYNENVEELPEVLIESNIINLLRTIKPKCKLCWHRSITGDKLSCVGFSSLHGEDGINTEENSCCLKFKNNLLEKMDERLYERIIQQMNEKRKKAGEIDG